MVTHVLAHHHDENTGWVNWQEGGRWYAVGERPAPIMRNKNAHFQTFPHQKSGHNKHLSAEEEKVFQRQLSEECSRAAAGYESSHCFSQAPHPEVRNYSKSPFQDEISPALEAVPPDL